MTRDSRLKREAPRREAGSARKGESGGGEANRPEAAMTPDWPKELAGYERIWTLLIWVGRIALVVAAIYIGVKLT